MNHDLNEILHKASLRCDVPGMQASVHLANGAVWSGAIGSADRWGRIPLSTEHIMRIGSITKTFVAALVLQLADDGLLSLEDALSKWFPSFPNAEEITVRELLSHTSGIPDYTRSWRVRLKIIIPLALEPQELIDAATKWPLRFGTHGEFLPSNTNYVLLGKIVECITGTAFSELLRRKILAPLDLRNTFFLPDEGVPENFISGFDRDVIPPRWIRRQIRPDVAAWATISYAAGACISTTTDLTAWVDALFSGKVLSPDARDEMTRFGCVRHKDYCGYGLGLMRFGRGEDELWGHQGHTFGFCATVAYSPRKEYAIAVIGNLSRFESLEVVGQIQEKVLGEIQASRSG